MSDRNTIPIDLDRDVMRDLLRKLQIGMLDQDGAETLRELLKKEAIRFGNQSDYAEYVKEISELIGTLNMYISGKINLFSKLPNDSKISGVT